MTRARSSFLASALLLASFGGSGAEEIPRDEYLTHVPLGRPRLVQETAASRELHLYGDRSDPGYRDVEPRDGIDDARREILMRLAVRFAPYLVQNSSNLPTNFDMYIDGADSFALHIDTWDVSGAHPERIDSKTVNWSVLGRAGCAHDSPQRTLEAHPRLTTDPALEDCKLVALLDRLSPGGTGPESPGDAAVRPRPDTVEVLFFDFPGEGPENWEQGYETTYESTPEDRRRFFPHANVHPFLAHVLDDDGEILGYELVLQYWFFYPSNDSGMNHEGDWEHINVVISPRSRLKEPLSADTIRRILDGELPATDDTDDPLVLRRVDYYFHHLVMTLDFTVPDAYQPRDAWKKEMKKLPRTRYQESEIWKAIRRMAWVDEDETIPNTHPFGYIGADNKGWDQALARPGGMNRNPHGTYPLPGRYNNVGPGGSTDQISVFVDPRRYRKRLAEGKVSNGPEFERGRVLGLADPDRLRLVPDWERVIDLVREDPRARREWGWLVLPLRWGYPATRSPFSGILEHFDTGNVSIVGPSYNAGWNGTGATPGFFAYDPHTLPAVFPLGPQDRFRNDLGFLNLPLLVLNLPPLDFLTRIVPYPFRLAFGRGDAAYYPKERLPSRFVGFMSGASIQSFHEDFQALAFNEQQFEPFLTSLMEHPVTSGADSTTTVTGGRDFLDDSVGPFFRMSFFIGDHFTSENTVRNPRTTFGLEIDFDNIESYRYSAEVNYWEYAGSIRYSVLTRRLAPFVKGGYGWSWYRLENVQAGGQPLEPAESDWIKPKNVLPNVWHAGLGLEYVPWRRTGKLLGGLELALTFEYARYFQDLNLDLSNIPLDQLGIVFSTLGDVPSAKRVSRDDFLFGLTLSW